MEGGDVGIDDTLYQHFSDEYSYIERLAKYLKQWVRTIKICDTEKKSSLITNEAAYITFNYTAVLENVYGISPSKITHIHGSLRQYDIEPVLGHGNQERIKHIRKKREEAESVLDEKWSCICRVVEDYYKKTFKDVNHYSIRFPRLDAKTINEICVIGHSLAGVDRTYFNKIDNMTLGKLNLEGLLLLFRKKEKLRNNLIDAGIDSERIELVPASEFYDL